MKNYKNKISFELEIWLGREVTITMEGNSCVAKVTELLSNHQEKIQTARSHFLSFSKNWLEERGCRVTIKPSKNNGFFFRMKTWLWLKIAFFNDRVFRTQSFRIREKLPRKNQS